MQRTFMCVCGVFFGYFLMLSRVVEKQRKTMIVKITDALCHLQRCLRPPSGSFFSNEATYPAEFERPGRHTSHMSGQVVFINVKHKSSNNSNNRTNK